MMVQSFTKAQISNILNQTMKGIEKFEREAMADKKKLKN